MKDHSRLANLVSLVKKKKKKTHGIYQKNLAFVLFSYNNLIVVAGQGGLGLVR